MAHSKLYVKIMNSREWRMLRKEIINERPLCERCQAQGYVVLARCVHHIVPVESGRTEAECYDLAYRRSNLQALCFQCHNDIHKAQHSFTPQVIKERNEERLSVWADQLMKRYGNKDNKENE